MTFFVKFIILTISHSCELGRLRYANVKLVLQLLSENEILTVLLKLYEKVINFYASGSVRVLLELNEVAWEK